MGFCSVPVGNSPPKLSLILLLPASPLFNHRQGYRSHCMRAVCVSEGACVRACVFVSSCECVPLPGFPVCYCGHDRGRRAGTEEVCVVVLCGSRSYGEWHSVGRAQCVLAVRVVSRSHLYPIFTQVCRICLKSTAVASNIIFQHSQHRVPKENDGQIQHEEPVIDLSVCKSLEDVCVVIHYS